MNERYKYFYQLCLDYEKKMKNLNGVTYIESKFNQKNKESSFSKSNINENFIEKNNESKKGDDDIDSLKKEIENNKMLINIAQQKADYYKEKYSSCKNEFDDFKNIFLNENRNLKFKLESSLKEKDKIKKKIIEFNQFYQQIKST